METDPGWSQTVNSEFFNLHKNLPREGPGQAADVHWALSVAGTRRDAKVLDAACGPGADTLTLAQALPQAKIKAVDRKPFFIADAVGLTEKHSDRVSPIAGNMFDQIGPFDLIWCAGALYFEGVVEGLDRFAPMLGQGGRIAFSDAVWLKGNPPAVLEDFWSEYPDMTDVEGLRGKVERAGFEVLGERILSNKAWDNYYDPMAKRIDILRQGSVNSDLAEVLEDGDVEIAMRRQYPEYYSYALFVVAPL